MSSTETVMLLEQSPLKEAGGNAQSGCKSGYLSFSYLITSTKDSRTVETDDSILSQCSSNLMANWQVPKFS